MYLKACLKLVVRIGDFLNLAYVNEFVNKLNYRANITLFFLSMQKYCHPKKPYPFLTTGCEPGYTKITTEARHRKWTVGPLSSATRRPIIMQFTGCDSVFIGQKMQLNGWHNGNEMRNVICVDTQTSMEWRYCLFPIL